MEFQNGDDNDDVEAHRSHHQGGCERRGLRLVQPQYRGDDRCQSVDAGGQPAHQTGDQARQRHQRHNGRGLPKAAVARYPVRTAPR